MGEFVELDAAVPPAPDAPPERAERSENWVQSSFDLAIGLEVRDFEDTVPEDLFDELFGEAPSPPRRR